MIAGRNRPHVRLSVRFSELFAKCTQHAHKSRRPPTRPSVRHAYFGSLISLLRLLGLPLKVACCAQHRIALHRIASLRLA